MTQLRCTTPATQAAGARLAGATVRPARLPRVRGATRRDLRAAVLLASVASAAVGLVIGMRPPVSHRRARR